jgi:hypothetical protein
LRLAYRTQSFQPSLRADIYLAVVLPGPTLLFIRGDLGFTEALTPFVSNFPIGTNETTIVAGHLPASIAGVAVTLYAVLCRPGMSPADTANWLSNLASLNLELATLSLPQQELLADRGHPNAFRIRFDHAAQSRLDTWIYQGGGLGQTFHFQNGRPLLVDQDDEDERYSGGGTTTPEPTLYSPGRFTPSTTIQQIQALLGDPDHVLEVAGRELWVYDDSRITVTVGGGAIAVIEAY